MTTNAHNTVIKENALRSLFDNAIDFIDPTVSFNEGDMLYLGSSLLNPVALTGDVATFVGIARCTVVLGLLKSPYSTDVDTSSGNDSIPGPGYGGEFELGLNTGDSINPGDPVYPGNGLDAQTVTSASAGGVKAVGLYVGPAIVNAAAGTKINVLVGVRYPENTLKF